MKREAKICDFACWCEEGPVGNFLLHSKSTRTDGSFDYLCQSYDSVEEAYFVGEHLTKKMRETLTQDGLIIVGSYEYKTVITEGKH